MKPERIAHIKRLLASVPEGPWMWADWDDALDDDFGEEHRLRVLQGPPKPLRDGQQFRDLPDMILAAVDAPERPVRDFLTGARTIVPELVEEVERLEQELAEATTDKDGHCARCGRVRRGP